MTSSLRAATNIAAVTLGSRVLGLARDVIMFRMLGISWVMGAFALAWMIPNMLRRLFGEGALAASFIPAYAKAEKLEGPEAAKNLLASVTGLLLVGLVSLSAVVLLLCFLIPPSWIGESAEGVSAETQGQLLLDLTFTLFPYAIPICCAAILTGALNSHGTFALPAAAPIILNVFWIGGLAYAWATSLEDPVAIVRLVAVLLAFGGLAQLSLSLVPLWRRGLLAMPRLPGTGDPARDVVRAMIPTLIGMSLVQLNSVLDQLFALYLVSPNAPGYIFQANRLLLFPHALTSLAVATAIFPRLAALGVQHDRLGMRKLTDKAMHHTLLVALPAAIGMMLVAQPLLDVMLSDSAVTDDQIAIAAETTIWLVASLPMIGIAQLHARAFYALGDYRTPAWMSFWLLVLNAILDVVFVVGFELGVPGLAMATSVASVLNAGVLRVVFRMRCPTPAADPGPGALRRFAPMVVSCTAMGFAVYSSRGWFLATTRLETVLLDLLLPVLVGLITYAAAMFLLGQRRLRMR